MKNTKQNTLTKVLFIVYLCLLTWIILFKLTLNFSQLDYLRSINWIPFGSSAIVNGRVFIKEIIYNIVVFIPVGIYISLLKTDWSLLKKIAPCFLISLAFEVLQFIFAIGASDITDLIGNTLGGIMGISLFYLLHKLFKTKTTQLINMLALLATIVIVILLTLLIFINI